MRSLTGQLIIASPQLRDPNFAHTVTLIVSHDEAGAMGLVLNRPTNTSLREGWEQVSELPCGREAMLHHGGPCAGPLMVLHGEGDPDLALLPGVGFTTEPEAVETLVQGDAEPAKFIVGYAGWSPGQIESEIKEGSWLIHPGSSGTVFGETDGLWEKLITSLTDLASLAGLRPDQVPEDPSVN